MRKISLNKLLVLFGVVAAGMIIIFFVWWNRDIVISNSEPVGGESNELLSRSSIVGLNCENRSMRPLAVMLASDPVTRPLSGIGQADLVFEIPVTPEGITRFMAVYQCEEPAEIGSVRSAREDFIPLAAGLGAIYVHWGGEHDALRNLDNHIIDNIDALRYESVAFFRKPKIKAPHNGFTTFELLKKGAEALKYSLEDSFGGYPHSEAKPEKNLSNVADTVTIAYPFPLDVKWVYDGSTNEYKRFRGNVPETDKNTNTQVTAKVIVTMDTTSSHLRDQYIGVKVQGRGDIKIYQNGIAESGYWQKDTTDINGKLYFYDRSGNEFKLVPGKIWVEIVTNSK